MHIVGGLYREQCCIPSWDELFGSGGRAAAALSSVSPGSSLYTYAADSDSEGIALFQNMSINVHTTYRPTSIVFSYFHPLSKPHIQPLPENLDYQPAIKVSGDAVLRFGFLEGEAVIEAQRAVYDPQTWRNPIPFGSNGSIAAELAIVLNELELRSSAGLDDLTAAASTLMKEQGATIVVVKRGIRGAIVFDSNGRTTTIPPYRSSRVFKIGTGDVFSAVFAHHWAEKKWTADAAADAASRSVAVYCSTAKLPLSSEDEKETSIPINTTASGLVLLEGAINSLGQRYTMEEARFVLRDLGVDVICPALGDVQTKTPDAVLIIEEGLSDKVFNEFIASSTRSPTIVLHKTKASTTNWTNQESGIIATDDFSTALYFAAWSSIEHIAK